MKTKIYFYSTILIIGIQSLNGQNNISTIDSDQTYCIQCLTGELFAPDKATDPTTWFNTEWLSGDIYLSNGEIVRNKLIRYNGSLDELFWLEPKSGKVVKLDKEAIVKFHLLNFNEYTSVYFKRLKLKFDVLTDSSEVFVQEIYNGKLSLYILHTFYVQRREILAKNNVYFEKEIYVEKPVYFLNFKNKKTVTLKSLNCKNLYAFIPDKKEQIKQFFKLAKKDKIDTYLHMIILMKFLNYIADQ
ncbi:MAG: hypothetical protein WCS03_08010 [Bacteroidota bacterium]